MVVSVEYGVGRCDMTLSTAELWFSRCTDLVLAPLLPLCPCRERVGGLDLPPSVAVDSNLTCEPSVAYNRPGWIVAHRTTAAAFFRWRWPLVKTLLALSPLPVRQLTSGLVKASLHGGKLCIGWSQRDYLLWWSGVTVICGHNTISMLRGNSAILCEVNCWRFVELFERI